MGAVLVGGGGGRGGAGGSNAAIPRPQIPLSMHYMYGEAGDGG